MQSGALPLNYLPKYSAIKKVQLLKALKRLAFSGELVWNDESGHQWTFYLHQGQIIYATGGIHTMRRWKRHRSFHLPHLNFDVPRLEQEMLTLNRLDSIHCWEYELLHHWMMQGKIARQDMAQMIHGIVAEVLFDVVQASHVTHQLQRHTSENSNLAAIALNEFQLYATVQAQWEVWIAADLQDYSPLMAPVMRQPEQIQTATPPHLYQMLEVLLDGQSTMRDLAVQMQRDVLSLMQALQPYIQLGWVDLIETVDDPAPIPPLKTRKIKSPDTSSLLIACVDDSPLVCQSMEQVVTGAGYRFLGVTQGSRAIATLLAQKPDLIFLDLIMPETNGYEICSQLRKVSLFKEIPIIILTGNDGIVDQVRARLLGASDFISKPIEFEVILSAIRKHLEQTAPA